MQLTESRAFSMAASNFSSCSGSHTERDPDLLALALASSSLRRLGRAEEVWEVPFHSMDISVSREKDEEGARGETVPNPTKVGISSSHHCLKSAGGRRLGLI